VPGKVIFQNELMEFVRPWLILVGALRFRISAWRCSSRSQSSSSTTCRIIATNEVIADKAFDSKLRATLSGKSYQSTPEALAAQIKSENEKYGALIRTLNIKIQ